MENKELRRQNLMQLIEKHGSIRKLADQAGTAPNYLSEVKNRVRDMGDKVARKLENGFDLPVGWMDRSNEEVQHVIIEATSPDDLATKLSAYDTQEMLNILQMAIKMKEQGKLDN